MTTSTTAVGAPAALDPLVNPCIAASCAPPCAQPLDSLHKHLYAALIVLVGLLLFAINAIPPEHELPPASCAPHIQQ